MDLSGKTAIVTGAANGIGLAIAQVYHGAGAQVVIADLCDAEAVAARFGGRALGLEVDVSSQQSTLAMVAKTVERFGAIDILVNNAGLFTGVQSTPMEDLDPEDWRTMFAVNVMGPWLCVIAALPHLKECGIGRVINIASVIAHNGIPFMLPYVASKGAVSAMTRAMAREFFARQLRIRVNSISPGYVHSANALANASRHDIFEAASSSSRTIERPVTPADIAGTALWLAGGDAAAVNGQNLIVDGGGYMSL